MPSSHDDRSTSPSLAKHSRFTIDPSGPLTHDQTVVDVVAVPCPFAHPLRTWSRDALIGRYFGALSMRDAQRDEQSPPSMSWIRHGVRREADRARILLYELRGRGGADTLSSLADGLVDDLSDYRDRGRPVVFVAHGLGGLVVKMALVRDGLLLRDCYGVAFFGTPHQGSSYFAMPSLANSIQSLLQLSQPLPTSVTNDLRVGSPVLLGLDQDFRAVSHDLQVWTFYETIDSRLQGGDVVSGGHSPRSKDASFAAPLTSIRSAILGMRQERIFPLQSDHANLGSFGRHNVQTLRVFLKQLARQIDRAAAAAAAAANAGHGQGDARYSLELDLESKVAVEVHGFFDDPVPSQSQEEPVVDPPIVRAWSTRLPLREFLDKGPELCLDERLNEVRGRRLEPRRFSKHRGRTNRPRLGKQSHQPSSPDLSAASPSPTMRVENALGIRDVVSQPASTTSPLVTRPVNGGGLGQTSPHSAKPGAMPLRPFSPPPRVISSASNAMRVPSPLIRADFEQDLAVDRLSPPLQSDLGLAISPSISLGSDGNQSEYRDFPPLSPQSRDPAQEHPFNGSNGRGDVQATLPPLPKTVVAIRKVVEGKEGQRETVMVAGVPAAFATPEVKNRKFLWIHVPFNNPAWVKSILQRLETTYKSDYSTLYGQDFWMTRHTRGRHAQHYAHYAKPDCHFSALPRTLSAVPISSSHETYSSSPKLPLQSSEDAMFTCLLLPYIHFDSYKRVLRRRNLITERLRQGRVHPVPEKVAKSDSLELQVIWEYLGHDPPVNCRRTLDQYEYPSLRDTRYRDDEQMLYKLTKERTPPLEQKGAFLFTQPPASSSSGINSEGGKSGPSSGSSWRERILGRDANGGSHHDDDDDDGDDLKNVLNGNVLMVDQLWLWVIQSHTVVSFFPKREGDPIEGPLYQQADLRNSIFNEVNIDLTRQCENALDLAALAALHAVSVLLDRSSHPNLEIFRIFEEAISVLTERLTFSLKGFRAVGFRDKASSYEATDDGERSILRRHKEEGRRAERANRDNTSALLELRDIQDELQTLLHIFERQTKVVETMQAIYNRAELRDRTVHGRSFLAEALRRLADYVQQVNDMEQRVRSTRDDYDKLLQMVQRQAQVDEVRLSRLHADLASAQGRSVIIFTTYTVIFLPLSFFTGLFGMNTREWGGDNNPSLGTIGTVALPASAFLVVASLVVAFSPTARRFFSRLGGASRRLRRRMGFYIWRLLVVRLLGAGQALGWTRRGEAGQGSGSGGGSSSRRRGNLQLEASDFWERHGLERDGEYEIPQVNKRRG